MNDGRLKALLNFYEWLQIYKIGADTKAFPEPSGAWIPWQTECKRVMGLTKSEQIDFYVKHVRSLIQANLNQNSIREDFIKELEDERSSS